MHWGSKENSTNPIARFLIPRRDRVALAMPASWQLPVPPGVYALYEKRLRDSLERTALPHHVAVLADGNRRWARQNAPDQPLVAGYRAGASKLKEFVAWCAELGISNVTLWVLSTDNLDRSEDDELTPLFDVIVSLVRALADNAAYRVRVVGDLDLLPSDIAGRLRSAVERSENHQGICVNVAVAYGGRHELRDAVRNLLLAEANQGRTLSGLAETLTVGQIEQHLYTKGQPDPDLIIRTSGEQRLSGFMLWQSAHSEFYFCEALWPDFRRVDFYRALRSYAQRERRFGK